MQDEYDERRVLDGLGFVEVFYRYMFVFLGFVGLSA